MPSAVLNYLVASIYSPKKIVDSVASTIVVSTLISFITIPVVVYIALRFLFLNESNNIKFVCMDNASFFMDAIAKYLSSELSFFQITWARYFFTVVFTLSFMFIFFRQSIRPSENIKLQVYRGLTLFFANICFFILYPSYPWLKH